MKYLAVRLALVLALIGAAQMLSLSTVLAHTGEDASSGHVIVEFGRWGLGVAGVLAAIIVVAWIRTKLGPR